MKTFHQFKNGVKLEGVDLSELNEEQLEEAERIYNEICSHIEENGIETLDEGLLGSILGGAAGFIAGPAIGKIIANALGVERGVLYDLLTSRLVTTAIGAALGKRA
jgi:hypothetical protein